MLAGADGVGSLCWWASTHRVLIGGCVVVLLLFPGKLHRPLFPWTDTARAHVVQGGTYVDGCTVHSPGTLAAAAVCRAAVSFRPSIAEVPYAHGRMGCARMTSCWLPAHLWWNSSVWFGFGRAVRCWAEAPSQLWFALCRKVRRASCMEVVWWQAMQAWASGSYF
jgi:hypothetical protein